MTNLPDLKESIRCWQQGLQEMSLWIGGQQLREYVFHSTGVAEAAATIASKCGMDEERAYICGLLHDFGKRQNEKQTGRAHFIVGYEDMMSRQWSVVARVCLTHSFPDSDFDFRDYTSYKITYLQKAKSIINNFVYDDYDKLIQLCDIFFEATSKISYQQRIACIRKRYNLKPEQTVGLETKAAENKALFDKKCGCDIYKLLNIEK